jgi:hypothetical protein
MRAQGFIPTFLRMTEYQFFAGMRRLSRGIGTATARHPNHLDSRGRWRAGVVGWLGCGRWTSRRVGTGGTEVAVRGFSGFLACMTGFSGIGLVHGNV